MSSALIYMVHCDLDGYGSVIPYDSFWIAELDRREMADEVVKGPVELFALRSVQDGFPSRGMTKEDGDERTPDVRICQQEGEGIRKVTVHPQIRRIEDDQRGQR